MNFQTNLIRSKFAAESCHRLQVWGPEEEAKLSAKQRLRLQRHHQETLPWRPSEEPKVECEGKKLCPINILLSNQDCEHIPKTPAVHQDQHPGKGSQGEGF